MNNLSVDLSGKVAIITGAGRGIGRATAIRLAKAGATVVLAARTESDLNDTQQQVKAAGGRAVVIPTDVTDEASVRRLIDQTISECGQIDLLFNNAGVAPLARIDEMSVDVFDENINANIRSVYLCSRAAWPHLAASQGAIINTASVAAFDAFPGFAAYGAAKAFVVAYTKFLAREGADRNIRVYCVAPGAVETEMLRGAFPDFPKDATLDPDDIAKMVAMLASDGALYSSGQTITVSKSI